MRWYGVICFCRGLGREALRLSRITKGAKHLAQNPMSTSNSKHIDGRHHVFEEVHVRGEICCYTRRAGAAASRRLNKVA